MIFFISNDVILLPEEISEAEEFLMRVKSSCLNIRLKINAMKAKFTTYYLHEKSPSLPREKIILRKSPTSNTLAHVSAIQPKARRPGR